MAAVSPLCKIVRRISLLQPILVDGDNKELTGPAEGNLCINSSWPGQMRTVYGDHQRFIDTYFTTFPGRYFSGDGCRRDEDGYYWITGRVDDVINVSGHRMGTAEVESALKSDWVFLSVTPMVGEKILKDLKFRSKQTVISFISTITLLDLKKFIKVKNIDLVRAIPLPPISLKKGPIPICPPNAKVKKFFNNLGTTVEIKNEKLSINFWSTSGMMASYYEILRVMSDWLVTKGVKKLDAQKYITSLFLALSEDAIINAKKDLKILVKDSQTPKGLNEQGL